MSDLRLAIWRPGSTWATIAPSPDCPLPEVSERIGLVTMHDFVDPSFDHDDVWGHAIVASAVVGEVLPINPEAPPPRSYVVCHNDSVAPWFWIGGEEDWTDGMGMHLDPDCADWSPTRMPRFALRLDDIASVEDRCLVHGNNDHPLCGGTKPIPVTVPDGRDWWRWTP